MLRINAMGEACPRPVIKTRNAIRALNQSEQIEVKVDNEIAVQNLQKMAEQMGFSSSCIKNSEQEYTVQIEAVLEETKEVSGVSRETPAECKMIDAFRPKKTVVVLRSKTMGVGEEELGAVLMKGYIFALTQLERRPDTVLLYNGGAFLSCEGSDSLEDLKNLEAAGTGIFTCGTCLNYYGLTEKLSVGSVTNMYEITRQMAEADLILQP